MKDGFLPPALIVITVLFAFAGYVFADSPSMPFSKAATSKLQASGNVVLNEFRIGEDDRIELVNTGTSPVDLTGWQVVAKVDTQTTTFSLPSFTLESGAYAVLHEAAGTDTATDLYFGVNISWANGVGGSCALLNASGTGEDFARWGTFTEPPPTGTSWSGTNPESPLESLTLGRDQLSTDTNDGADFTAQNNTMGGQNDFGPAIYTTTLIACDVGWEYSYDIKAAGGVPPYTYSLVSGSLPPGLNLSSSGTVTGTPTTVGEYAFTVDVVDSDLPAANCDEKDVTARITAMENILLVADDWGFGFNPYFELALSDNGYKYDLWRMSDLGEVPASILNQYLGQDKCVIWFTGDEWSRTLTDSDQVHLSSFLDAGGKLFLSGQDIGYDLVFLGNGPDFYRNYLHARYIQDVSPALELHGLAGNPIGEALAFGISGGDGANNQIYPSAIDPLSPAVAIFTYQGSAGSAAPGGFEKSEITPPKPISDDPDQRPVAKLMPIRKPIRAASFSRVAGSTDAVLNGAISVDTGVYRLVYFAFGFEGINSADLRNTVMNRVISWLTAQEYITVTSPNGSEDWAVGSVHNITWTSSGTSGTVKIDYSVDNGSNWIAITPSTADNGSFTWTVLNNPSANCLVKVTDTDGSSLDQSNGTFTISLATQITDLRSSVQGKNILLEWSSFPNATSYNVYRGTSYNFVPDKSGGSNRIGTEITDEDAGSPGIQWSDTGNGADIVGDINNNYFYRVTALVPSLSLETDPSNLAGEYDYGLVTTAGTDINEIVLLMDTQNTQNPITDAEQLAQAIPNCTDVYYWDAAGQGTVGHPKGLPFGIFAVTPGNPYIANVSSPTIWTVAGSYVMPVFDLITTSGTDINHLAVPLEKGSLTTAEALGQDILNCTDVYYWDAAGQGTVGHVVGLPFGDFPVLASYPYYINETVATTWPNRARAHFTSASSIVEGQGKALQNALACAGVPHTVYGKLALSNELNLENKIFKIRAWIESRPNEILTQENTGAGCDGQYWWIAVSNFPTKWGVGEKLYAEISNEKLERRARAQVELTTAGSDYAGEINFAEVTDVPDKELSKLPKGYELMPNYPNPFNPETLITFGLPKSGSVSLNIYDMSGRLVRTLVNEPKEAGYQQVRWNGQDNSGRRVSSAIYLCVMESSGNRQVIKLALTK